VCQVHGVDATFDSSSFYSYRTKSALEASRKLLTGALAEVSGVLLIGSVLVEVELDTLSAIWNKSRTVLDLIDLILY
jgi:hypothetical protein